MQTQTSNALHNAIMEAGSKDRPPMLAPDNEVLNTEGSSITTTESYMENYKNVSQDIRDQLNAKAEAVQIILTGIDNDIYSTVDACPNACEMWKAIERSQQAATRNRGKEIVNSPPPIYDQEPTIVAEDDEMSKDKDIDKLMALISLSFKKIYKPTNNNLRTSSNTSRANQDNSLRINRGNGYDNQRIINVVGARENVARECQKPKRVKDTAYHKEKMLLCKQKEAGFQLNAEQAEWKDDTDDESKDQELEAHYMYMAKLQEVTPDATDNSEPIFDTKPLQHVPTNDNYNVFAIESEHPEQSKSIHDAYPIEKDEHNVIIDSLDMSYDREQADQDNDDDLANEHDLLASLIKKLKCEIDDSKNRNTFLETSNKALVDKLKGEIEDFKNKNKSLESSNNRFKEANNKLSETNELMYNDLKKFQAELDRRNDVKYVSEVEIDCATAKGDLISYKMESRNSFNAYTQNINDLNQTISEMKNELFAHQKTISILTQQKEAQIKLYKSREDKEIDKVIALENKVKVLDNFVYKTGQSVQIMNMLNRNCKTSFAKPEFLKKAQRANPRLYDIGCYNDNLALMLGPESDEVIHLEKESRSKLSDLIRPFDYEKLNNLYDMFVPQREKSSAQRYFSERINAGLEQFHLCLKEEMVADLRYFNSLEFKVDSLRSQLETQKTQFLNEIDRLSREYYYADHMNAILGVYTELDEVTNLQCDYLERLDKCECIEKELSKRVILPTSVSRPQLKRNQIEDRVMLNNSQGKKHLNAKTSNVNFVYVTCGKCVLNDKHDMCVFTLLVEIILFIVDSGCSEHMTGNLKLLTNFVEKFLGTVKFRNDQIAPILGYGDLVQGKVTIKRVYYVKGLNHNLFSVGQLCDADLEVAFRKSTCYIRDLKGNDLLTGSRGTDLYSITLQDTSSLNPICLMAKATSSQAWLWHCRLSHLNFDTINLLSKNDIVIGLLKLKFVKDHLCSSCELEKAKQKSFQTKITPSSKSRLQLLHMDLCGPMRIESINGKKYVLVIVDDYSRYTWTHFLRSKDETPEVLIDFLRLVQRGLHAQNRTLVEVARTMLSAAKVPLFFWSEAIATSCFTQNRSLVIPRHEKTPYHIINNQKPSVKFFHIFGSLCNIVRDGENLDKMKEKGDVCIFVGYSTQSRAYRVFNKRTRVIVETIHVNFDELPQMALDHISSDPVPQCQKTTLEHISLSPGPQSQEKFPHTAGIVTTSNELELLFSLVFDELLIGSTQVVSKCFDVPTADAPHQFQQQLTTPMNTHTTPELTCQDPSQAPTVTSTKNISEAETISENAQVEYDEFINIFYTPVQDQGETSSRHVDSSNMHTFYQRHPSEHHGKMCMFALTVSRTEPKNIKEAMADSAWIESMQEELHQFDRLDVWELVDRPLYTNVINMKWL
nr:retrovirus-related Pol polyprotein from transposon TNT 1-94 [Tanacetum cinerariifolium]